MHRMPNCYGVGPFCLDDCSVSCVYWEDCMDEIDAEEDDEGGRS